MSWTLDASHSSLQFRVRHLMIQKVRGHFASWAAEVAYDDADRTRSTVTVTIDAASIQTGVADRDKHLRSADFLDAAHFPHIVFRASRVDGSGDRLTLHGDLTIRGVTQPVAFEVERTGAGRDPWGGERIGFSGTGKLSRKEFGLTWNQLLEAGGVAVGDEVAFEFDLELVRAVQQVAA